MSILLSRLASLWTRRVTPKSLVVAAMLPIAGAMTMTMTMSACSDRATVVGLTIPLEQVPASLRITPGAVNMAVGATQQLSVSMTSLAGTSIPGAPTPVFSSTDTSVQVTASGLVTSISPTYAPAPVAATVTYNGVTLSDTIPVMVTSTVQSVATFSVHPDGPATVAINSYGFVTPTFLDDDSLPVYANFAVRYRTAAPKAGGATLQVYPSGYLLGIAQGTTWLYATSSFYGVTLSDSVQYTVTDPDNYFLEIIKSGSGYVSQGANGTLYLIVNGTITFYNSTPNTFDIIFDKLDGIDQGNITSLQSYDLQSRTFTKPGTYGWRTTTTPVLSGKVLVR